MKSGQIETRSGSWEWLLIELYDVPSWSVAHRRIHFQDPANPNNEMSVELSLEWDDFSDGAVAEFARHATERRFEESGGRVWIANPVRERYRAEDDSSPREVLLRIDHTTRVAEFDATLTLGDLTHDEVTALVE